MRKKAVWAVLLLVGFAVLNTVWSRGQQKEAIQNSVSQKRSEQIAFKGENDFWEAELAASQDSDSLTLKLIGKMDQMKMPESLTFSLLKGVKPFAEFTVRAAPFPENLSFSVKPPSLLYNEDAPLILKITGENTAQYFQMYGSE
ncbi:hypothetical protein ACFFJY_09880 [Fictibacillus aquaticus]|uniref:Uncharacterized protein n=1 Tax=Fictibacillus aquaticus TaxID=2021314 RepID=A0A235FBL3_9BACL|nr:hypothetical protein [Fictibacillus aquaticus]OYD58579.1 hypothetical protein CGZ90_01360 [Fictibacillus aquaticus]